MSRETWNLIKNGKNFNVSLYRNGLFALIIFLVLTCILELFLFYIYIDQPEREFYATSGVTPPIMLQPLTTPNYSPNALLPPDPPVESQDKLIPQ